MKQYVEDASIAGRVVEISDKVAKLREYMTAEQLDGIYISKQNHFAWITAGGDNIITRFTDAGVCAILITQSDRYFICNNIEAGRMKDEEFLDQLGFKEMSFYWYEDKEAECIAQAIGANGKLAADIPMAGAVDANPIILDLEKVLSENEIGRYLYMGSLYSKVIEEFMETIRPGDTERKIAGGLAAKMWENGLEPVLFLVASDERVYKYRHPIPTDKPVEKWLMISCNARYKGLVTKITRMMYFGDLPKELNEQYLKTLDIENQMIRMTKAGVDDLTIYHEAQKLYAEHGYPEMWKEHHQGGPQSYTNGFYLTHENSHEVIRQHQCYCYNPSITGTKSEDAVIITEEGPIFVTYPVSFPAEVSIIDGHEYRRPGILVKPN